MPSIMIEEFRCGEAALEQARIYVAQVGELIDEPSVSRAATVALVTEAARLCLEQAAANETYPANPVVVEQVRRELIDLNSYFYSEFRHGQRVEIALARGFEHAGHVEWTKGSVPALVYWLNNAYPPSLSKAKIQARALRRAGKDDEADRLLLQYVQEDEGDDVDEAA